MLGTNAGQQVMASSFTLAVKLDLEDPETHPLSTLHALNTPTSTLW